MEKKKIAIIGATEFQLPLIKEAKQLGYETYVFAWESGDVGEAEADHFVPISVIEKDRIYQYCVDNGIDSAASIGSDITILTVNYLLRRFHKPCNSELTDEIATNKYKARKVVSEKGLLCPKFILVDSVPSEEDLAGMKYPLIVKPTDRSGSRGIYKSLNYEEVKKAVPLSIADSFEKKAIVEEFIDGPEYSAECFSYKGEHKLLTLTKKYTTEAPNYIETGHDQPSDIPEEYHEKITKQIFEVLDALGIEYGASVPEFRIDEDYNAHIIEVGPRMGGDHFCHLVPLSTGYDYIKMVIDVAEGRQPDYTVHEHYKKSCIRFIMTKDDIETMHQVEADDRYKMIEMYLENNDINDKVTNSTDRHGYYIYVEK